MKIIESKSLGTLGKPGEDAVVVTAYFAAVIDGATPKTSFRYPNDETPGQMAARLLSSAIEGLPPEADCQTAIRLLSRALHQEGIAPADRPTASIVIYSERRREVWAVGDCLFATLSVRKGQKAEMQRFVRSKLIDLQLSAWRRDILLSGLSRGIYTKEQIMEDDPGRKLIQPFISRQVRYQNLDSDHPLAYGVLDGESVPARFIYCYPLGQEVKEIILASDGYPTLFPTLQESEEYLHQQLAADPLCIGPLLGTKCVKKGQLSYDDRTYLRIEI